MKLIATTRLWRVISTLICAVMVFNLFYLGAKPVAVGLFPPPIDKVAHFITFSAIAFLMWEGFLRGHPWLLGILMSLIAVADEVHQIYLPGRSAGFDDFAMDILAVTVIIFIVVWRPRSALPNES